MRKKMKIESTIFNSDKEHVTIRLQLRQRLK